jgi:hypothetical protein
MKVFDETHQTSQPRSNHGDHLQRNVRMRATTVLKIVARNERDFGVFQGRRGRRMLPPAKKRVPANELLGPSAASIYSRPVADSLKMRIFPEATGNKPLRDRLRRTGAPLARIASGRFASLKACSSASVRFANRGVFLRTAPVSPIMTKPSKRHPIDDCPASHFWILQALQHCKNCGRFLFRNSFREGIRQPGKEWF